MTLQEYIKKSEDVIPQLSSFYKGYTTIFKDYYKWVNNNCTLVTYKSKSIKPFYCLKSEHSDFESRFENKQYCFEQYDNIASQEQMQEFLKCYSDGFNDGFNDIEFELHLTINIIDNIVYNNSFNTMFWGQGILRIGGVSPEHNTKKILNENIAYKEGYIEGKRFKSYFLYIEYYDNFKKLPEPFLRAMKYYETEQVHRYIHFTENKEFDLNKAQNIDALDNRLKTNQSKDDITAYWIEKLKEYYSSEDIEYFLKANFKCFDKKEEPKILSSTNKIKGLQKKLFQYMFEFYNKQEYIRGNKIRYAEILKKNFELMKNSELGTIEKAMRNY